MPLVEFAYNNIVHASTQETPFYINYGYPKINMLRAWREDNPIAKNFATQLKELYAIMKEHLGEVQGHYKEFVDVKRKGKPKISSRR